MAEVASAYISLLPSLKNFGRGISNQIGGDLDRVGRDSGRKFGGAMSTGIGGTAGKMFAPVAAGIAALGIGSFFKGAIGSASDLSESGSKVGVVFGKSAAQIVAASKTSAKSMGMTEGAYLAANGTLGNLLVSLKVAPKAAAGMSQQMVTLASDMASFNNVPIEDALAAIQSGLTGETEPLKAFGVNMNDATLKAEALKMGLIKTTKDAMTPQTKALAAQSLIMSQTGTAQGDFARTSGGLANQQKILGAQFSDVKTKIGAVFLPIVTKVVSFFNSHLMPGFDALRGGVTALGAAFRAGGSDVTSSGFAGVMERVGLAARVVFDGFQAQVLPVLKNVAAFITGTVVPGLTSLVGWLKENAAWLTPIAVGVGSMVVAFKAYTTYLAVVAAVTKAYAVVQGVLNAVMAANPIGLVVLALVGLVGGLIYAYKTSDTFRAIVQTAFKGVTAAFGWVWDKAQSVFGWLKSNWPLVLAILTGPIGLAVLAITKNWDTITAGVSGMKEAVATKFSELVAFVKGVPAKIVAGLGNLGTLMYDKGKEIIQGLINGVGSMVSNLASAMANAVKKGITDLLPGSPVKKGPLRVLNNGYAGGQIVKMLAGGIDSQQPTLDAQMRSLVTVPRVGSLDFASSADRAGAVGGGGGGPTRLHKDDLNYLADRMGSGMARSLLTTARTYQLDGINRVRG